MKYFYCYFLCFFSSIAIYAQNKNSEAHRQFYELRIYHANTDSQVLRLDHYLQYAFLPSMHKNGFLTIGIFKSIDIDTASDKKIYVLIPFKVLDDITKFPTLFDKDNEYGATSSDYENAEYNRPAFNRYETVLMRAFENMPELSKPGLNAVKEQRIYELRSYEGPTDKLYKNKIQMFNRGGEIPLFKRLGFNAVFYAEVLSGSRMPNLMYMTSFESREEREKHWKAFTDDAEWKKLSSAQEYQHNVSKADIIFLHPVPYSDL